jgi:hypothetical protein
MPYSAWYTSSAIQASRTSTTANDTNTVEAREHHFKLTISRSESTDFVKFFFASDMD